MLWCSDALGANDDGQFNCTGSAAEGNGCVGENPNDIMVRLLCWRLKIV